MNLRASRKAPFLWWRNPITLQTYPQLSSKPVHCESAFVKIIHFSIFQWDRKYAHKSAGNQFPISLFVLFSHFYKNGPICWRHLAGLGTRYATKRFFIEIHSNGYREKETIGENELLPQTFWMWPFPLCTFGGIYVSKILNSIEQPLLFVIRRAYFKRQKL